MSKELDRESFDCGHGRQVVKTLIAKRLFAELEQENERLRDELNALKKLERERWEGAAKAFGLKEKGE